MSHLLLVVLVPAHELARKDEERTSFVSKGDIKADVLSGDGRSPILISRKMSSTNFVFRFEYRGEASGTFTGDVHYFAGLSRYIIHDRYQHIHDHHCDTELKSHRFLKSDTFA